MKFLIYGLVFSLLGGFLVNALFYFAMEKFWHFKKPKRKDQRIPPWISGLIERFGFTTLIGIPISQVLELEKVLAAMGGWITLKLAANWQNPSKLRDRDTASRTYAALLMGFISMFFALVGGLIARRQIFSDLVATFPYF